MISYKFWKRIYVIMIVMNDYGNNELGGCEMENNYFKRGSCMRQREGVGREID